MSSGSSCTAQRQRSIPAGMNGHDVILRVVVVVCMDVQKTLEETRRHDILPDETGRYWKIRGGGRKPSRYLLSVLYMS